MWCSLHFLLICATLVCCNSAAPWAANNNIREFDLEWQCEQFCNRLKGKLLYNSSDSACVCTVETKHKLDFDTKYLEHKLNDLGFNFQIIDRTKPNRIVKRETAAERIKKLIAEKNQREALVEEKNNNVAAPSPEEEAKIPLSEKLHRLRTKLSAPSNEKIITAPEHLILGKAAPKIEPENKPEHKEEDNGHKNNMIVGQEAPPVIEAPVNEKLITLRSRLNARKIAKHPPPLEAENVEEKIKGKVQDKDEVNLEEPKLGSRHQLLPISDRIKIWREKVRMRLHHRLDKPNEDGHVEEHP